MEVEAGLKIVGVLEGSREDTGGNRTLVGASCAPEKIEEKNEENLRSSCDATVSGVVDYFLAQSVTFRGE